MGVTDTFTRKVDALKYQVNHTKATGPADEVMTIKLRYKKPRAELSRLMVYPVKNSEESLEQSSDNFRFSAAVAQFGLLLRSSAYRQQSSYANVIRLATSAKGTDEYGYRSEFIRLVSAATSLAKK